MRIFIFAVFFAFLHAKNIETEQRNETGWSKLKHYQKITGITDEKIMGIWQRSQRKIRRSTSSQEGMPKLRVSTAKSSSGTVNPVAYEVIDYKHQMEYHNGVIIIMQPGWYTCTAATRGNNKNSTSDGIGVFIVVANREKTYSRRFANRKSKSRSLKLYFSKWSASAQATYSDYFNKVNIRIYILPTSEQHSLTNNSV